MDDSLQQNDAGAPVPLMNGGVHLRGWALVGVLAGLILTLLLAALDQTIVGTALPRIIGDLHGFDRYSWVVTAYLLGSTTMIPIVGKLSDQFGRKWFLMAGIVLFLGGSAFAGASQTMNQLIVFRGLQGVGGGFLQALVITLVGDIFPPAERARWQGVFGAVFALASVIGPAVGGWITDHASWRWVFYVNLPLGMLALLVLARWLPRNISVRSTDVRGWAAVRRIDVVGALTAAGATVCLLLGLSWGGSTYPWDSAQVLGSLMAAAELYLLFLVNERFAIEPILPLDLFKNQVFAAGALLALMAGAALFAMVLYLPLFIQAVLGDTATSSGAAITPLMITLAISSALVGQLIARLGRYQFLSVLGAIVLTIGAFLLSRMDVSTSLGAVTGNMIVVGLGLGLLQPVMTLAVQNAIPPQRMGVGTGAVTYLRSAGSTIGTAVLGAVVTNTLVSELPGRLPTAALRLPRQALSAATSQQVLVNPDLQRQLVQRTVQSTVQQAVTQATTQVPPGPFHDQQVAATTAQVTQQVTTQVTQLFQQIFEAIRQSLAVSIQHAFLVAVGLCAAIIVITMFLKDVRLRKRGEGIPIDTSQPTASPTLAGAATLGWHNVALSGVLLISAFLDLCGLTQNGYGNLYYTATVRSMLTSWHNFFFVSFDPGGFVTADKPPLDLWLQAASAELFGFNGVSLMLPQVLAGIASVAVLYHLVRRIFGMPAGLLAALALAITPVSVVVSRSNIVDGPLVLVVLLAAWAVTKAAETGHLRWLLLCAVLVGLGYNIKMLEAYLVVPAFGLLYLLAPPRRWHVRVGHLALATIVLLVVSLSWSVAVDSVPISQRPYVGSSSTNSEINLAFGYNGLERITGLFGFRGPARGNAQNVPPTAQPNPGAIGGLTGTPGPQRLIDDALGGQVSWLLPLALLGLLATCWQMRPEVLAVMWRTRRSWPQMRLTPRQQAFVLWGMWFLTQAIFFSVAAFFQSYYLVMLAPAIAALVGVGAVELWHDYRRPGWRGWLLPTALVLAALLQARLIAPYADYSRWLTPLVVGGSLLAAGVLTWLRLGTQMGVDTMLRVGATTAERIWAPLQTRLGTRVSLPTAALAIGMAAVLVAPTTWSLATVQYANNGFIPVAGPAQQNNLFVRLVQVVIASLRVDPRLVSYLETHQGNAHYLVATLNALTAAPIILESGKPVMALGGFSGIDQILTTNQLASLVASGEVRYFWLPSSGSFFLSPSMLEELPPQFQELLESAQIQDLVESVRFNSDLTGWVSMHCTAMSANQWSSPGNSAGFNPGGTSGGSFGHSMGQQLYDCASHG